MEFGFDFGGPGASGKRKGAAPPAGPGWREQLPAKERVVFALRFIEGMDVTEVAALCEISPATVKRRTQSAQERFWRLAGRDPVLKEWREDQS